MAAVVQTGKAWIANFVAKSLEKVIDWKEAAHDDDDDPPLSRFSPKHSAQTLPQSSAMIADTQSSTQRNNTKEPFYAEGNHIRVPCYELDFGASVQLLRFTRTESPVRVTLSDSVSTVEAVLSEELCDRFVKNKGRHVSDATTGGVAYLQSFEIVVSTLKSTSSCLTLFVKDLNYRGSAGSPVFGKPKAVQSDSRVKVYLEQLNGQDSDLESASNASEPEELTEIVTQKPRKRSHPQKRVAKDSKTNGQSNNNSSKSRQPVNKPSKYHDDRPAVFNADELAPMPTNMFMGHINGLEPVVPQGRRYLDLNIVTDRSEQSKKLMSLLGTKHTLDDKLYPKPPVETSRVKSKTGPIPRSKAIQSEETRVTSQYTGNDTTGQAGDTSIAFLTQQGNAGKSLSSAAEPAREEFHQHPVAKEQPSAPNLQGQESSPITKKKTPTDISQLQVDSYMHQGDFSFAKYITPSHTFCKAQNVALKQADSLAHPDPGAKFSTYSVPSDIMKNLSIIVEERAAAVAEKSSANRQKKSTESSQPHISAISSIETLQDESELESEEEAPLSWSSTPARKTSPTLNVLPPDSSDPVSGQGATVKASRSFTPSPSRLRDRSNPTVNAGLDDLNKIETLITSSPPRTDFENLQPSNAEHSDAMEDDDLAVEAPHALGDLPSSMEPAIEVDHQPLDLPTESQSTDLRSVRRSSLDAPQTPHTSIILRSPLKEKDPKTPSSHTKTLVPGTFRANVLSARSNRVTVDGGFDSDPADMSDQIQQQFEEDQTRASRRIGRSGRGINDYNTKDDLWEKKYGVSSSYQGSQMADPFKRKLVLSPKSTNVTMKRPKLDLMTQVDYEIDDPSVTARKNRREHFDQSTNSRGDSERTTKADDLYQPTLQDVTSSNVMKTLYPSIEQSPDTAKGAQQESSSHQLISQPFNADDEIQTFLDVFEKFRITYPEYSGTLLDFVGFCFWLHREITVFRRHYPIFVWDDMIVRFKLEYQRYGEEQKLHGLQCIEFAEFYANEISQPVYCKGIINKATLDIIMGIHNGSQWDSARQEYSLNPWSEAKRDLDFHEQYMARVHRQTPKKDDYSQFLSSNAMSRTGSSQSAASSASIQNAQSRDLLRNLMSASPPHYPRNEEHRQDHIRRSARPSGAPLPYTGIIDSQESIATSSFDLADLDVSQMSHSHSHPAPQWGHGTTPRSSNTRGPEENIGEQRKEVAAGKWVKEPYVQEADTQLVEKRSWFKETDSPFETFAKGYGALKSFNGVLGLPTGDGDQGMILKTNDMHHDVGILDWSV